MSITAHFIDSSWVLQNCILRFVYVPTPHTKEEIANHLMEAFTKWNIETKIVIITVDNASCNDGMIPIIVDKLYNDLLCEGKFLHMRCCAHILNLVVKNGLSIIDSALVRIRDSVAFWSATPQRVEKFEEMAKQLKISHSKKLSLDCKTRWNSTYLMLQTALKYKDIFPRLKIKEKNYSCVPTKSDWDMAKKIAEKLQIFFSATELFSGRKYPIANVFFISMCQLRKVLMDWIVSPDQIISDMEVKIFEKFDKYWSVVHVILTLAVILDPRYKMKVVEFYYPLIYGLNSPIHVEQVRKICYDLLEEYQSKHFKSKQSQASSSQTPFLGSSSQGSHDQGMSELVAFLNSSSSVHVNSELDHYLEESILP